MMESPQPGQPSDELLLAAPEIRRKIERIAAQILEAHPAHPLALVGIHTRGAVLCRRVHDLLRARGHQTSLGALDIALYRDDIDNLGTIPSIRGTDLPFAVEGAHIVLFDDVLFTGRTIRAALDAITDFGRPRSVQLAVIVDRGHRELPIRPDYVGKNLPTSLSQSVQVHLLEIDGRDEVELRES